MTDQQGEEVRLLPPTAGQLVIQCEEEERSRDGLVIGLRDRDVSQDRQWINISPREVLVLCLHLVRGDPGHIAQVLDLKGHRVQEVAGGSSFTRREITGNCSSRAVKPYRCRERRAAAAGCAAATEGDDLSIPISHYGG